jgi:hypothetical protein
MRTAVLIVSVAAGLARAVWGAEPAVTIYNRDFAVVRETIPLDLQRGLNDVRTSETTAHLEPDSVMLRDPTGRQPLRIVEQNFRGDPVSSGLLLSMYEGKTIDFLVRQQDTEKIVPGRIIRSAYVPHYSAMSRYGRQYAQQQGLMSSYGGGGQNEPIIEVEGKLRFGLPGQPLFPALTDDSILRPTLQWQIETDHAGKLDAELAYITGGMSWEADYNIVSPEQGDLLDLVGWVTIDNQSGRTFREARVKLVAGDVNKLQADREQPMAPPPTQARAWAADPAVTEKALDEYHLYTLARLTTVRDRETKQVEFIRAAGIPAVRFYVYDGVKIDAARYRGWGSESYRTEAAYGTECNPKVWVMREFKNSTDHHLGMPLPKGRLRFYRQDTDGQLEFVGEDVIDHTPRDETVRVYTGNAFDLVGERHQTNFRHDPSPHVLDETFEIKLRNHKTEPVEVRVVEHLYRWSNWEITENSHDFTKTDARTIEFRVHLAPETEEKVTYTAHYTWEPAKGRPGNPGSASGPDSRPRRAGRP